VLDPAASAQRYGVLMTNDDVRGEGQAPRRTRWNIRREAGPDADYNSAEGRFFAVGDQVVLPPPLPRGSLWTVIAVEPPQTEGYDGTLVLEPAAPLEEPDSPSP
jgi:hypothetical protein